MTVELARDFRFESAHTLARAVELAGETEASRRVHGHSYRAEVALRGEPDARTGMLVDLGVLEAALGSARAALDHRLLDDVEGLGPPTLENLARWIWRHLAPTLPRLHAVTVHRDSQGERCTTWGD